MNNGWVKLHRKMVDWEWFQDVNTFRLFIYLLMTANHEERKWKGNTVLAGQKITSLQNLGQQTKMSVQEVRTALSKLKSTGEITHEGTSRYSLITISNWSKYQDTNKQHNKQATNKQQTSNTPVNNKQEVKNEKNDKNNYGEFGNVLLSTEEYTSLCTTLTEPIVQTLIAELDEYIESKGVRYKSHRATIQSWARRKINDHAKDIIKSKAKVAFV